MDTLHDARGPMAVVKPVTEGTGLPVPTLLLVGGDASLRARLSAELPEFQVLVELLPGTLRSSPGAEPSPWIPDLILAALPLDVAGRALLSALPASTRPPMVAFIEPKDEPILRLVAASFDEVVVRPVGDALPPDLARRLMRSVGAGSRLAAPTSLAATPSLASLEETVITRTAPPSPKSSSAPVVVPISVDLADLIDDVVIEFDSSCRVVAANAAAGRLAKLSRQDIIGRSCAEVLPAGEGCAAEPCLARRAREAERDTWLERERGEHSIQVLATPRPGGSVIVREADVTSLRRLQRQLARSLDSLEVANAELVARASCLERVVQASTDLKSATTQDELADRVLRVLSDLPGFSLVAIGMQEEDQGATQLSGVARLPGGLTVPLGRRTVLLDILNLSNDRRRVSNSQVVMGLCVSIHGSPDTWGPRTSQGEWDLAEVFDGAAIALTPIRASSRSHGFLLVKAASPTTEIDPESLRVVEILANIAAVAFDNLRSQDAERRRAALTGMVSRLGRTLINVHEPDLVLDHATDALRGVLDGANVAAERVREAPGSWTVSGILAGPRVIKAMPDSVPSASMLAPVAAQLIIPVRVGERVRAVITATSPSRTALDDVDLSAIELFAKVVGKAHANADAFHDEQVSLQRLRLVADIGRMASASLDLDEVLARSLAHLCQHGAYEMAAVATIDEQRGKLVLRAQASRTGVRIVEGLSTHLSQGICGMVASTGIPALIPDVSKEPAYLEVDPSVRSELCVPLVAFGGIVGVLDVESHDPAAFDESDLAALTSIADHLAAALHNARLYRQVTDKNRELRDSERNKSEFLSIVAHDLRTPLTSIRSAAEMILMYRDEPAEVTEEFTRSIRDEAARLGRLVDDFLAHSRIEAGILDYEVGEVDLAALLEHFCRVFDGPASQKRIVMELSVPSDLPPALADKERVSQVVANLLSNATKFTPEGGHIRVTAWVLPAEPDQVIGRVRVDVSDTGPGVEEFHRERIFQKFVRLDGAAGGGAGLGLPIARAIIEHLGGRLWLDAEPGRGSTFSFVLPARLQ